MMMMNLMSTGTVDVRPHVRLFSEHVMWCLLSEGGSTNWKMFEDVKAQNLGQEKAEYFTSKATIVFMKKENCMYTVSVTDATADCLPNPNAPVATIKGIWGVKICSNISTSCQLTQVDLSDVCLLHTKDC